MLQWLRTLMGHSHSVTPVPGDQVHTWCTYINEDKTFTHIKIFNVKNKYAPGMVVHTFNPSTWDAEAG